MAGNTSIGVEPPDDRSYLLDQEAGRKAAYPLHDAAAEVQQALVVRSDQDSQIYTTMRAPVLAHQRPTKG